MDMSIRHAFTQADALTHTHTDTQAQAHVHEKDSEDAQEIIYIGCWLIITLHFTLSFLRKFKKERPDHEDHVLNTQSFAL